jgi:hypothetical protein
LRFFVLCVHPAFRGIGAALAAMGIVTLVQQEFLPHPYCDYRVFDFLPNWGWLAWLFVILLLLFISALEALYQYETEERRGHARPRLYDHRGALFEALTLHAGGQPNTRFLRLRFCR